ncbi:TPA: hypothetical protein NU447_004525 [Escherichia coli]|nr:hypothetical protein [Escherichia coli]
MNDDNDTNESTQPNPAALERVSATEKFPEQLPGVLFVTCPGGCSLRVEACRQIYEQSHLDRTIENPHLECRRCPIGFALWSGIEQDNEAPVTTLPETRNLCPRCSRTTNRLIAPNKPGSSLCVSCWNREREASTGVNARGRVNRTPPFVSPFLIGIGDGWQVWYGIHQGEVLIRAMRANQGARFHDRRPGPVGQTRRDGFVYYCHEHREPLRWNGGDGHNGQVTIACPRCQPWAASLGVAPVMQPITIQTASDAAHQYRNATLPDNAVWTASVCAKCRTAPLIIGKAPVKGKPRRTITVTCPACGDSATDRPGGRTWTDEYIAVPEFAQNETRSLAKIPVVLPQKERAQPLKRPGTGRSPGRPRKRIPLTLDRVPESRFNRLTLSVLAAVGRWDYINDIIRRIDRDRGDAATLIALADHIQTNRPERDL